MNFGDFNFGGSALSDSGNNNNQGGNQNAQNSMQSMMQSMMAEMNSFQNSNGNNCQADNCGFTFTFEFGK